MYSCFNWDLCFSEFLHWLHDRQKSVLAYDKHGKLAAGIRVQQRELDLFPMQSFLCYERKIPRLFKLFPQKLEFEFTRAAQMPVQPAIPSPLVLETVPSVENSSCCNNTTKNQSLSGPVLLRHHKAYRSATRARALSPSLRARASPVTDVGSGHAHTVTCKEKREESNAA